jgi:hypothetical protein
MQTHINNFRTSSSIEIGFGCLTLKYYPLRIKNKIKNISRSAKEETTVMADFIDSLRV